MKTLTLKEAYAKATPGPFELDGSSIEGQWPDFKVQVAAMFSTSFAGKDSHLNAKMNDETKHNAALLAHAFNVLPEVVDALMAAQKDLQTTEQIHPRSRHTLSLATQQMIVEALAKANQVKYLVNL